MKLTAIIIFLLFISAGTAFACYKPVPTPLISPTEDVLPSETITPTLQVTTEPSSTIAEPTLTLTPTPTAGQSAEVHNDGLSDGLSSCPDCTKAHPITPIAAPNTGRS